MALQMRNKRSTEFSASSMSDLVFLLLIFFMLTSTLISPNAIKVLLPNSTSKTMAKQNVTVYINEQRQFFVGETPASEETLLPLLEKAITGIVDGVIVLRADKTVPIQYVVNVNDAVTELNAKTGNKHKIILATAPKE